jgi:ATP synthase in type III secretion protein N
VGLTAPSKLALGTCALGRAIDGAGLPLDGGPNLRGRKVSLELRSPAPNERAPIASPLPTGIRVIDGLLTIGRGARVGIFGAPGAGKTTLVESIARFCTADVVVVALVGERGREAQRWIERRDCRTTVVCATSDRTPRERIAAAQVALAHAAALRERGLDVLLVLDSLARCGAGLRELAIAAGESAGRAGYPPSVFAALARLVEVPGAVAGGTVTLLATVINDGDDRDPMSEAARALLDGHIVLSARLAEAGRFPAVDVLASASRTMSAVVEETHALAAAKVRRIIAVLDRVADARTLGIESATRAARAEIAAEGRLETFLRQGLTASPYAATLAELKEVAALVDDGVVFNSATLR